jgi:hypothetical protein
MAVIDIVHPYMPGASAADDHLDVTCVPSGRVAIPQVTEPTLHRTMSAALTLVEDGRMSEAVSEALRLVEERIRSLTESDNSGHTLTADETMEYLAVASMLMRRLDGAESGLG